MIHKDEAVLCPTCGSPVRVVSVDEGTSHYEPYPQPAFDPERPWDHAYVSDTMDRCLTCGVTGSYGHTEDYYRKYVWSSPLAAEPVALSELDVERLARAIHGSGIAGCRVECFVEPFSDADYDYAVVLNNSYVAAEYARLAAAEEGAR